MQQVFSDPPSGGTPLLATLRKVYADKKDTIVNDRKLLIIVATDGQPSDCNQYDGGLHQSFIIYLPQSREVETFILALQSALIEKRIWNILTGGMVKSKIFDNTDDFREEQVRVKRSMGQNFKFDYTDYVVKIYTCNFC